jgi:RNA polymerase sigma-70 factor (ECF subfamily)
VSANDDRSLAALELARAGDAAGYRELFRSHVAVVQRMLTRICGRTPDLDDLTQTVFIECFRTLPTFRGEALFTTWLGRITARVAMRSVRRPRLTLVPLDEEMAPGDASDATVATDERKALERVERLLDGLKPKQRIVFVLHVLEGYSVPETAELVGKSEAAVKLRLRAARKLVERRALKDPVLAEWFHDR